MALEQIPFDLYELLANCQSIIYPKAIEKGLELHLHTETAVRNKLFGDPLRFRQVILNLLSNAIKFTNPRGKITLNLKSEGGFAVVSVTDTGIGIDIDTQKHIFDKFYQGDASHAQEGNGLGLALVKKTVDLLGGTINVDSERENGTTFKVFLKI